ncbi:multiple antibiotic resistance protein, MarC family [Campylobacter jejuni subsp. doylei]|nr:multiple antibiotic resistance protein, MarC family [Campylobacter jejuni subsp. doylei]
MFSSMGSELYLMLLVILNPFGNLTQFLAMSDGLPLMPRKKLLELFFIRLLL